MSRSWQLLSNGSYLPMSQGENVLADTAVLLEDMATIADDFRAVCSDSAMAVNEARVLVAAVRKDRRLRTTQLRLVGQNAAGASVRKHRKHRRIE